MRVAFKNFTGGEVTPTLSGRYDLGRYQNALRTMENFLPNLHGDAFRRPGTYFLENLGADCVLIPFIFNADSAQNFVLVFGEQTLRIANANGFVVSTAMVSPYALEDVPFISYAQVGDIVYLAHEKYALHKVVRSGSAPSYTWTIGTVSLNSSLPAPSTPSVTWNGSTSNYTLRYKISAVDEFGKESLPSSAGACTNGKYPTDWTEGNHVTISWGAVPGAKEYNIYRESAGYYGFIGVAFPESVTGGTVNGVFVGSEIGNLVNFSGAVSRSIVVTNGYSGATDSDTTSPLNVVANSSANAFSFGGKLLVWITKTTTTTTWRGNLWGEEPSWNSSTTSTTEYFWGMVETTNPVGAYSSYTRGNLGDNSYYPSGTIGAYTVYPRFSGGQPTFDDQNYEADTAGTPKEDWDPFADGNNPCTVTFHQQRMVLAGTKNSPQSFYMSRTGDFENFRKSRPLQDDDPVEYQLASGSVDGIVWAASFGDLLLGTSSAEYKATGGDGAITAKNCTITAQSYWGSAKIAPLIIGNSVMHCQRHGSRVRDLYYSLEKDGYAGNDLSIMAPHLFDGHSVRQWAFQQTPFSTLWVVRDDGVLLALTYMKEHDIWGWSRHVTEGKVRSAVTLSGENADELLLVVERVINGSTVYALERLMPKWGENDSIADAFFVDCGLKGEFETASDSISGLSHLEGMTVSVLADGAPVEGLTVSDGSISLPFEAHTVIVGLPYTSTLSPMAVETDTQQGSTLGLRRGYGQCAVRMFRSVGGKFGTSLDDMYDFPFTPEDWGTACVPFSGDIECTPGGGQDADTGFYIVQDRPLPMQIVAIMVGVDFGQQG